MEREGGPRARLSCSLTPSGRIFSLQSEHTFDIHSAITEGAMLTARQQEIWQFLVGYVDGHGYPPP